MNDLIDRNAVLHEAEKAYSFEDRRGQLAHAIQAIKNAPAVNRWIPCSERLPEDDEPVLITCNSLCVHKAWYDDVMHRFNISDSDYWYREDAVLAWMPMPDAYEPPKEGADDA